MAKKLRSYLANCPDCQLKCTPRHSPYGSLQPVLTPPRPFHTITIDFILALPESNPDKHDCALSVTDKFSKAITLIPGQIAWGGEKWAPVLMDRLSLLMWGVPRAILSDRDPRFVSQLWKGIFQALKVHLLYSNAYPPQTDGASEPSNQTVEIALRYYLATLDDMNLWPTVLPRISFALSNASGQTATQVLFGFRTTEALDFLRLDDSDPLEIPDHPDVVDNPNDAPDIVEAHPVTIRSGAVINASPTQPGPTITTTTTPTLGPSTVCTLIESVFIDLFQLFLVCFS